MVVHISVFYFRLFVRKAGLADSEVLSASERDDALKAQTDGEAAVAAAMTARLDQQAAALGVQAAAQRKKLTEELRDRQERDRMQARNYAMFRY